MVRMKYVVIKKKSYWFQKAIPNRLIPIAGKQKFVVPLNMKVGSTTENELEKARLKIVERFNLYIKTLESSDPTLFNNDELIMELVNSGNYTHCLVLIFSNLILAS